MKTDENDLNKENILLILILKKVNVPHIGEVKNAANIFRACLTLMLKFSRAYFLRVLLIVLLVVQTDGWKTLGARTKVQP